VFLPLLTLQGLEGKLFVPVALTIVFALAGSLLLSLTVVPVLASFLLKKRRAHDPWLVRKLLPPSTSRCWPSALKRHARIACCGAWPDAGVAPAPTSAARQDLHADHGRRRHHRAAGEAAVDQPRPDRAIDCRVQQALLARCRKSKASSPAPAPTNSASTRWA
jgi:multidrug efflux pump subunit AcrB